jgi:hypothetical protein
MHLFSCLVDEPVSEKGTDNAADEDYPEWGVAEPTYTGGDCGSLSAQSILIVKNSE